MGALEDWDKERLRACSGKVKVVGGYCVRFGADPENRFQWC